MRPSKIGNLQIEDLTIEILGSSKLFSSKEDHRISENSHYTFNGDFETLNFAP